MMSHGDCDIALHWVGYGLWFMSYERALWGVKERESVCVEEEEEKE